MPGEALVAIEDAVKTVEGVRQVRVLRVVVGEQPDIASFLVRVEVEAS